MHRISSKKIIICLVSLFILVTCVSCKANKPYYVYEYINYLANKSGIQGSENIEDNFKALNDFNILDSDDSVYLNDELDYDFLSKTICKLIGEKEYSIDVLASKDWISKYVKENSKVNETIAKEIVDKAVFYIDNRVFDYNYDFEFVKEPKDYDEQLYVGDLVFDETDETYKIVTNIVGDDYEYRDAEFSEIYAFYELQDTYEVDFSNVEVIPYGEEIDDSGYINNKFNLLASKNHVFNTDGYRISYTLSSSGIDFHISKKVDGITIYADADIKSVKPSFKWTYKENDVKNCYFNLKMNTTTSLGATIGKYGNYYLKLKDKDSSSFMSSIKSMIVPKADEIEAIIPICEIKTPIPNVPFAYLNMSVGIKLYVSGKIELTVYNNHNIGFEIIDGKARFFYDHKDDVDAIVSSSAKAALALNVGLDATKFRLCDVELDGGIKSQLKTTVHLYDDDFIETSEESDIAYSTLEEVSKDNPYVKVCGDVSLYWLMDLVCNTSKSMLKKWGFSKTFHILDDDNQIFGNLHHIEDGQFVKTCTRKSKKVTTNQGIQFAPANKIVLNTYAEVLLQGDSFTIEIESLPENYSLSNIVYNSSNTDIATVINGVIKAIKPGNAKISVYTSDNKYISYINILVSTG